MPKGELTRRRGLVPVCALVVVIMSGSLASVASASSDAAVPLTTFSEASACGSPYVGTPIMSRSGDLADGERVLGPLGRVLGRAIGEVRSDLVDWTVPMSGGRVVKVHRAALAAFQRVSARLGAEAAAGRWYPVDSVSSFVPRTIGGVRQLSRHALGIAIDINPTRNPASDDPGSWTTDMPPWFVQAWRDAGFCWGGDWQLSKDPMHFSWMGPEPASGGLPLLAPLGAVQPYRQEVTFPTGWAGLDLAQGMAMADLSGFGASDVIRLRDHPAGIVLEVLSGRSAFSRCSLRRVMLEGASASDDVVVFGDVDGDSRSDAVVVSPAGSVSSYLRSDWFSKPVPVDVTLPPGFRLAAVADTTGDRRGDLHLLGDGGIVTVLAAPSFDTVVATYTVDPDTVALVGGDRDGDGVPEMFALTSTGRVDVLAMAGASYSAVESVTVGQGAVAFGAADMDGDARSDLSLFGADGSLTVWVGNTPTGRPVSSWWVDPDHECPATPIPFVFSGRFFDDDGTGFQWAIESIAADGITLGCNPPFDDAFCPEEPVTRGQMAAFLDRTFGLPPASKDWFADDDGSPFEDDINRLAAAGVTVGCDVARYCPDRVVRRDEMAAFLARSLGLTPSATDGFADDDGSVFEGQIGAIADAGITVGCADGLFCPDRPVLREEMAAFLARRP